MNTFSVSFPESNLEWRLPSRGRVGMYCLIGAESAIFTIFVVAYLFYIGKSLTGPKPSDVLHAPIFYTICLLSSSLTIHIAVRRLSAGKMAAFARWWLLTIVLGGVFLSEPLASGPTSSMTKVSRSVPIYSAPRITLWSACMAFT